MSECVLCTDVITNPLCPECLLQEMMDWAYDKEDVMLALLDEMESIKCFDGTTPCLKCSNNFSICAYCFTEQVRENLDYYFPEIAAEFSTFFNFREIL